MFNSSIGDLYSKILCFRKIFPISFFILQSLFTFTTVQSICKGFSVSWNSSVNSRFSASSSSSRRKAEQNAGCHCSFFCFSFLFFNCSPFIIQNCYTLFNAQKSRINKLIKFKQMEFLAETASEKRYDYYIICVCPLQEKTFQVGKQKAMQ